MDKSKIEMIVLAHTESLKDFLGLSDWKVYWEFQSIEGEDRAICDSSNLDYKQATITIDSRGYGDDNDYTVLDTMFHELCHVLHADFTNYRLTCEAMNFPVTDQIQKVEHRAWRHAAEGFVLRMEWIWRNTLRDIYLDRFTDHIS